MTSDFIEQAARYAYEDAYPGKPWGMADTFTASMFKKKAAAAAEQASSASPPFFALSPPAKMDSIASPPTPASANGPTPAIAGSLAPLVYAEDFIEGGRWWGGGALAGR